MVHDEVMQALRDSGCCEAFVQKFLRALDRGDRGEQLCLLSCQRGRLLECVHDEQRKLECLDHLRYQIQKQKECNP